jgi:hypothetical protein
MSRKFPNSSLQRISTPSAKLEPQVKKIQTFGSQWSFFAPIIVGYLDIGEVSG